MSNSDSIQQSPALFAKFEPVADSVAHSIFHLSIRPAQLADADAIARLSALRDGRPLHEHLRHTAHQLRSDDATFHMLIAMSGDNVIGFGKTSHFDPHVDSPRNIAPRGWYLAGLIVHPDHRRRGIGLALTSARLACLNERATQVYYCCNAQNHASIALHTRCGFIELTRDFVFPGATFQGGVGVLCTARLDRSDGARAVCDTALLVQEGLESSGGKRP